MEVKKGYKWTEVGVIPEEWIEAKFEDVMNGFSSGQTPYRAIERYYTGNIPWITSGELKYNVIEDTFEKITLEAVTNTNLKIIPKGTFLFAITGLEAEGTRGSCAITGIEATTNQSCMALYPKAGILTTDYLFHFYLKYGNWLAFRYCQGTKQQSYTGAIAKKLPIVLPQTVEEQTAIATALSDTDALISSLEKLIEKKRLIKQGAMQELLKPKEGWEVKRLGGTSILKARIGWQGLTTAEYLKQGDYFLITGTDFLNGRIDWDNCHFVDYFRYSQDTNIQLKIGDVLVTKDGTIGKVAYIDELPQEGTLNSGVFVIRPKNSEYLPMFLFYLLNSNYFTDYLRKLTAGSTISHLYQKDFIHFEFPVPPTIEEQIFITATLADMDAEIETQERRLSKNRHLKQGMMQELLTGKTRLI